MNLPCFSEEKQHAHNQKRSTQMHKLITSLGIPPLPAESNKVFCFCFPLNTTKWKFGYRPNPTEQAYIIYSTATCI